MLRPLIGTIALVAIAVAALPAGAARAGACAPGPVRSLALISASTGAKEQSYPGAHGISVVLADGHGGWFAGGSISCLGGVRAASVLHLDRSGRLDGHWTVAHGAPVLALARSGTRLFAATAGGVEMFAAASGRPGWRVAASGGEDLSVLALAASPSALYVGGGFARIAGAAVASIAALDPQTGVPLPWRAPPLGGGGGTPPFVDALALDGSRLFVGGNTIRTVGGVRRPGLAVLDGRTGALTAWVPGTARGLVAGAGVGDVETILVAGGEVFTAGLDGFGVTDARSGKIERWSATIEGVAYRFASAAGLVYLGGNVRNELSGIGGKARDNLAAVALRTGRVTGWAPHLDTYVGVQSLAASRRGVLVAGSFSKTLG